MADSAECLQVVQRALASSAVDWTDVVNLPEIPFNRSSDHLVQLFEWQLGEPSVLQDLLSLGGWSITNLNEQVMGVEAAVLTDAALCLQYLRPHVSLAGAQLELLLTPVAAESSVPRSTCGRAGLLAGETQRDTLTVHSLQVAGLC